MENKKILLLISKSNLGDRLERAFRDEHFEVTRTEESEWAIKTIKKTYPHAIIIDWDYVNGTTKEINRIIKEECRKTALILLSKDRSKSEIIKALKEGADDCLIEPTEIDELIAKVNALIRRIDLVDHAPRRIQIKDILINLDSHEVKRGGKTIELTYTQFKILHLLISNREYVFSRNEILNKIWGDDAYVTNRTVDVHVKRLREKLGAQHKQSEYIQTIHGLGYRFA